ncbi:MAG: SDR family oxidoreductase [Alphaproteobacteria bacterium]
MTNSLEGKTVLITGGGRGLGRAMALGMAKAGAAGIAITAAESADQLDAVADEIREIAGPDAALPLIADVTDAAACERAVAHTIETLGGLHVLINNAGRGQRFVGNQRIPFWENDWRGWRAIVDANVNGPFLMARAATPHMINQRWGRIINISKNLDSMHRAKDTPYGPSKAALEAMTMGWAEDLIDSGVTVNTLAPGGGVYTDFLLASARERMRQQEGGYLTAEVIAPAAVWLASEASDGITGCRYIASKWNAELAPAQAAEAAREAAIFRPPNRPSALTRTWQAPNA